MIGYEITIIGIDGDIHEIQRVLENWEIPVKDTKDSSVIVDINLVGEAVRIINFLGYETDEDENVL